MAFITSSTSACAAPLFVGEVALQGNPGPSKLAHHSWRADHTTPTRLARFTTGTAPARVWAGGGRRRDWTHEALASQYLQTREAIRKKSADCQPTLHTIVAPGRAAAGCLVCLDLRAARAGDGSREVTTCNMSHGIYHILGRPNSKLLRAAAAAALLPRLMGPKLHSHLLHVTCRPFATYIDAAASGRVDAAGVGTNARPRLRPARRGSVACHMETENPFDGSPRRPWRGNHSESASSSSDLPRRWNRCQEARSFLVFFSNDGRAALQGTASSCVTSKGPFNIALWPLQPDAQATPLPQICLRPTPPPKLLAAAGAVVEAASLPIAIPT